jgi:hypothetical protein
MKKIIILHENTETKKCRKSGRKYKKLFCVIDIDLKTFGRNVDLKKFC